MVSNPLAQIHVNIGKIIIHDTFLNFLEYIVIIIFLRTGDCYEPYSFTSCVSDTSTSCDLLASSFQDLQSCGSRRSEYLFARFYCIPSKKNDNSFFCFI